MSRLTVHVNITAYLEVADAVLGDGGDPGRKALACACDSLAMQSDCLSHAAKHLTPLSTFLYVYEIETAQLVRV